MPDEKRVIPKGRRALSDCVVVWEVPTRTVRFRVPADFGGDVSVERVAGMLAMHCLTLKRRVEDFEILILPEPSLSSTVIERARQLITEGRSIQMSERLSPVQNAILEGVAENLSNKEIASKFNLSVCTVKFHVSSLLAKFKVSSRVALGKRAR